MPSIEILIPKNLNEVLSILSNYDKDLRIIAGGTDVVTGLKQESNRFVNTEVLVDINHVAEVKGIEQRNGKISIGAASTFTEIYTNQIVSKELQILKKAVATIGSLQIRNRATIAGNFVNNAPCADTVPALLIYNATIEIESIHSKREISLQEFLQGPYKTQLKKDEIVIRINIPVPPKTFVGDFYKLGRRQAVAISRITLAVLMELNENKINEIRIASGAATPIGTRFQELEKFAAGKEVKNDFLKLLASKLAEEIIKLTGLRWSSEYKLPVVQQMFYQMLNRMTKRIK
ncbi:MAG: FAD binding domain-containing protein [Ignavibacteriales bacterium]|nr:FAD binding domain-containing protein [Ignavibacteriales bacterium]